MDLKYFSYAFDYRSKRSYTVYELLPYNHRSIGKKESFRLLATVQQTSEDSKNLLVEGDVKLPLELDQI